MSRPTLFVAAGVCVCIILLGCAVAQAETRLGVVAGANLGRMAYDDFGEIPWWDEQHWALGFTGGIAVDHALGPPHALRTGLMFKRIRNRVDIVGVPDAEYFAFTLDYLCLPIAWKVRLGRESPFYAAVGAQAGYLLRGESYLDEGLPLRRGETEDIADMLEPWNVSANVGLGAEFELGATDAFVEAGYSHGLTSVDKPGEWATGWKTRELVILLGMLF